MSAKILMVHDEPKFSEEAAAALGLAGHAVATFRDPMEVLSALEAEERFDILITRVRFPPGRPNGVALAAMAHMKQPGIKVLFAALAKNIEYTEGLGEFMAAPVDIRELVATVTKMSANAP